MNACASPVKNIFSKAALAMLNACAKFAYNFAHGFGIKILRKGGSVVVSLDIDSPALSDWVAAVSHQKSNEKDEKKTDLQSGAEENPEEASAYIPANDEGWKRGKNGLKMFICCRQTDAGTEGALFFREVRVDKLGHLTLVSKENEAYGAVVTA
jgi:hypothetical protein